MLNPDQDLLANKEHIQEEERACLQCVIPHGNNVFSLLSLVNFHFVQETIQSLNNKVIEVSKISKVSKNNIKTHQAKIFK